MNLFLYTLLIYVFLTILTTTAMHDFSFRHTLFLLVDAILLVAGGKLVKEKTWYYRVIVYMLALFCSVFLIRYFTPTALKVWDVDIYFSFCLAIGNIFLLLLSVLPQAGKLKNVVLGIGSTLLFLPLIVLWGYFFSESSWLNVDGVMAILQTNTSEALEYVQDKLGCLFILFIVLYLLLTAGLGVVGNKLELKRSSWKIYAGAVLFFVLNAVLMFRTSDNFVTSIYAETKNYQKNYDEYINQAETRNQELSRSLQAKDTGEPGIFVLVIGESQNRTRMSAYGYQLNTTPWLASMKQNKNMLLFQNAYSCHVQTVPALTYALTAKNQYNTLDLKKAVSLIDVANASGYQTVWLSNQVRYGSWGTPVTVIAGAARQQIWINTHSGNTLDTDYYDGELIKRMQDINRSDKMLIVIHLMGNHISYHSRYPAEFDIFKSEGKRSEYDNSILYNDHVMKELLTQLSTWTGFKGLVYFSDHSEGVNHGVGHNPDTFIFDMAYIPMYMYFSDSYLRDNAEKLYNLKKAQNNIFTNDLIFNAMLGIMNIKNKTLYEPENDLTSSRYDKNRNRFMTLFGKRYIAEDNGMQTYKH